MTARPVVLVAEELAASALDVLADDVELRHVDGADRAALLPALAGVDAVLIRSATKMDAEALAAADRLQVVARAGIGLDNVDVPAATARGVMVVNAPQSNIVTAAEHAVALLLALARHIPSADASLRAGQWKRSAFTGVELADKTAGILGLGRIGVLTAQRLAGFGMRLVAYDPYVPAARAAQLGVRLLGLDDVLRESDFLSVHLPKTPETVGLIGERELGLAKPSLRLVNAARGGIVDEAALAAALKEGRIAGAAVDVFAAEPCTSSPLFELPNTVVTPHLGASTVEAQDKAGLAVARSVLLALTGQFVPDAVNVQAGGVVAQEVRPALPLVESLGRIFTALAGGVAASVEVEVLGEIAGFDVSVLELAALKGIFTDVVEQQVTFVNAPALAAERGLSVRLSATEDSPAWRNLIRLRGTMPTGEVVAVGGTLSGTRQLPKLVEVDDFEIDLAIAPHLAFFRYDDRPGIVGAVGAMLGDTQVNIAGAQVSRSTVGGDTLMALTVDSAVSPEVLAEIAEVIGASGARAVDLVES